MAKQVVIMASAVVALLLMLMTVSVQARFYSDQLVTTSMTIDMSSDIYWIDATDDDVTLTLPDVSSLGGLQTWFSRIDNSAHTVTLLMSTNGQTFDGASTYGLTVSVRTVLAQVDSFATGTVRAFQRI